MKTADRAPVAHNLKLAMARSKLSKEQLAISAGTSVRMIERYRAGTTVPPYDRLKKLAKALNKTPDWFYVDRQG